MLNRRLAGIAAAVAAITIGLSTPAAASVYTIDWNGTLDGSTHYFNVFNVDSTGVFGLGEAAVLTGHAITISVTVDTGAPGAFYENAPYSSLFGRGLGTPIGASITINGVTFALDEDHIGGGHMVSAATWIPPSHGLITVGDAYDGYLVYAEGDSAESIALAPDGSFMHASTSQFYYRTAHQDFFTGDSIYHVGDAVEYRLDLGVRNLPEGFSDGNVETPPPDRTWTLDGDNGGSGSFSIYDEHDGYSSLSGYDDYHPRDVASASFLLTSVTVRSADSGGAASVPEPSSGALMLAGLVAFGFARRGRGRAFTPRRSPAARLRASVVLVLSLAVLAAWSIRPAQAAPITQTFHIVLSQTSGIYSAGHVIELTASYDTSGTTMHIWRDGLNGTAEFGAGEVGFAGPWALARGIQSATSPHLTLPRHVAAIRIHWRQPGAQGGEANFSQKQVSRAPFQGSVIWTEYAGSSRS